MKEKFAERLNKAGWNKERLIALMNELDQEKRDIKIGLRSIAHDPKFDGLVGKERQYKIHRMKSKERYLVEEREIVRLRISRLNQEQKSVNMIKNQGQNFSAAFMVAAEEMLDKKTFNRLKLRADEILSNI